MNNVVWFDCWYDCTCKFMLLLLLIILMIVGMIIGCCVSLFGCVVKHACGVGVWLGVFND